MPGNITILKTETVKPAGAVAYEGRLYLTAWDQIFGILHAKTVHFYKPNPSAAQEWGTLMDTFKGSMGRALAHFSPLAGRLRWADESRHRLEIDCNGEGAVVVEAECDGEMSWFRDGSDSEKLKRLVATTDYTRPVDEVALLVVQVTRFRLARGEPLKEAPFLDRTIFQAKENPFNGKQLNFSDHIEFQNPPLVLGKEDSTEERMKETVKVVLPLTKTQLDTLKNIAASSLSGNGDGLPPRGHKDEQPTAMSIAIDVRSRIHTFQVPQRYFGNTILVMRAISQVGELISKPMGLTCAKLRETINKVDEDYIRSNIDILEKKEDLSFYGQDTRVSKTTIKGKPFYGNPNLRVISWLTLPIYEMDFGWGNVIDVIPIARDLDGSSLLLPGPEKDGSIVVVLCLQVACVDEFKNYFYENINN
ncbi:hypothetical protein V2J09_001905 [Rumex salicifolius]